MKSGLLPFILLIYVVVGCQHSRDSEQALIERIDSLERKLETIYNPGFGYFMGSLQKHHDKLWFAGTNENWELATFEIHEIEEIIENIKTLHPDREETQALSMIEPRLTAVAQTINQQNKQAFRDEFLMLTNTCNTCHQVTDHKYIIITVPSAPHFTNQDFKRRNQN